MIARMVTALLAGAGGAWLGWQTTLARIPYKESEKLWETFLARGMKPNVISPPFLRNARKNDVPMDNADTLTNAAVLDLEKGPLIFQAVVPEGLEYWSVSIFAHNADTVYVINDTQTGPGVFRLLIRSNPHQFSESRDDEAILPGRKGFLVIRTVMPDRNDRAGVAELKQRLTAVSLVQLAAEPA